MFSVIHYTLPRMLKGNIQSMVLQQLVQAIFTPNFAQQPELIVVTNLHIPHLDSRIKQIILPVEQAGHLDIYKRILKGLEHSSYSTIFLSEQDVLYPKTYFQDGLKAVAPLDKNQVAYNKNILTANAHGFFKQPTQYSLLSNLLARKNVLEDTIQRRVEYIKSGGDIIWAEPGMNWDGFTDCCVSTQYFGRRPSIDIRHGNNLTGMREAEKYRSFNLYWGRHKKIWRQLNPITIT